MSPTPKKAPGIPSVVIDICKTQFYILRIIQRAVAIPAVSCQPATRVRNIFGPPVLRRIAQGNFQLDRPLAGQPFQEGTGKWQKKRNPSI
jgi:hypothetical protein